MQSKIKNEEKDLQKLKDLLNTLILTNINQNPILLLHKHYSILRPFIITYLGIGTQIDNFIKDYYNCPNSNDNPILSIDNKIDIEIKNQLKKTLREEITNLDEAFINSAYELTLSEQDGGLPS